MSFYYTMAAGFWLLAWFGHVRPGYTQHCDRVALGLFVAIAGVRFETGYDWIAYERYFNAIAAPAQCYNGPVMEPLFWSLTRLVNWFSHDVQSLFFVITVVNAAVLWRFCRRLQCPFALAAAIYFGWVYLTLQMGALRQSLGVSLFLMAMLALEERRRLAGSFLGLSTLGFQTSGLFYLPLLWRGPWAFALRLAVPFTLLCVLWLLFLPSPATVMVDLLVRADLGFLSEKLRTYQIIGTREVTAPMVLYLLMNGVFLVYAQRYLVRDVADRWLLAPLMLMMLFQAFMADWPIFWMRIMALTIPCQAVLIGRTLHRVHAPLRVPYLLGVMVISLAALSYFMRNPFTFSPYVPYQTVAVKYVPALEHAWLGITSDEPVPLRPKQSRAAARTQEFYQYVEGRMSKKTRGALLEAATPYREGCFAVTPFDLRPVNATATTEDSAP